MTGFTLGVAGSIVATALTVLGGWMFSRQARWWILSVLSRLSGLGDVRVYRHQSDANHELAREIGRAGERTHPGRLPSTVGRCGTGAGAHPGSPARPHPRRRRS